MSESTITKQAIAVSFKTLMEHKAFDKITIADIAQKCGLNRQTFYYHFQDKYALLNWIYYNEVICEFNEDLTFENWNEHLLCALNVIQKNIKFYRNALTTSYSDEFRSYFFKAIKESLVETIHRISKGYTVDEGDIQFIADFFAYGISGTITNWICHDSCNSTKEIVEHIENLINDCELLAVKRYFRNIENADNE